MERTTRAKNWVKDIIFLTVFSIISAFAVVAYLGMEHIFLKIALIILFVSGVYSGIAFICSGKLPFFSGKDFDEKDIRYKITILVLTVFAFMPIMVHGFFYHDDWLNFSAGGFLNYSITQARPVVGLFTDLASNIQVDDSWMLGGFAVTGLIIYIEILYEMLKGFVTKEKAGVISLSVAFLTPIVNVLSYKVMYIYIYAAVFSALSIIFFHKACDNRLSIKRRLYCLLMGTAYICYSNMIYQVTATIAFFALALLFLYGTKKNDVVNACYIIYYICSTAIYYIISKILLIINHAELLSRSETISSIEDIKMKILFFAEVLSENIKQIIVSFTYNLFFRGNNSIGKLQWRNPIAGKCVLIICFIAIGVCLAGKFIRSRRWIGLWGMMAVIPLSYYPFLILKESSYASYYSISLCSILLVVIIEGISIIFVFLKKGISWVPLAVLCCIEIISCNVYMSKFWVTTNKEPYDYIVHELGSNMELLEKTNWIHIYGTVQPGQVDIYAIREVQRAMKEYYSINECVKITTSDNLSYCNNVSYETYEIMAGSFTEEDVGLWQELYIDNSNFGFYSLDKNKLNNENADKLMRLFNRCEMIPVEGQAVCIYLNVEK